MKDDLDKAMAAIERIRKKSRKAAEIAKIGTELLKLIVFDVHDALDLQKARQRVLRDSGYETE